MYIEHIELIDYGPISHLAFAFPFDEQRPKPVVLVGRNGSGKTILLSHIVNALLMAQQIAFPRSPEVEINRVMKGRSASYVRHGGECSYSRVNFQDSFYIEELYARKAKGQYTNRPHFLEHGGLNRVWETMKAHQSETIDSNIRQNAEAKINRIFSENCVLYFPSSRFDDPAWLTKTDVQSNATLQLEPQVVGETSRRVVRDSVLRDIQDWIYEVIFDSRAFELITVSPNQTNNKPSGSDLQLPLNLPLGYHGPATSLLDVVIEIVSSTMQLEKNAKLSIGRRTNRALKITTPDSRYPIGFFHLSSGEMSLVSLFLSILQDFEFAGKEIKLTQDVRGIVLVDEVDLHLHSHHQYDVLPKLIEKFPLVQWVVTTHSPLFILGLRRSLGDGGYVLLEMPSGRQIGAEAFDEFESTYNAFAQTERFSQEIEDAIMESQVPTIWVDGKTDIQYIERAAELLSKNELLSGLKLIDGGGDSKLKQVWNVSRQLQHNDPLQKTVVILHDCESGISDESDGRVHRRKVPQFEDHPINRGVENLFAKETLEKAKDIDRSLFGTIEGSHSSETSDGIETIIPENWQLERTSKTRLCDWICEIGDADDFKGFLEIFSILEETIA